MKELFFTLLFLYSGIITSQNLNGKWALVITNDMHVGIESLVLDISDKKMKTYDFDSLMFVKKIKIDTIGKIVKQGKGENVSEFKYNMKDSITLTQHVRYQSNRIGNWKTTYWDYVKLLTTQINYPLDSVLNKQYDLIYPISFLKPQSRIRFKGLLCGEQVIQLIGKDNCPRYRLEKIDQTYFVVYYSTKDDRKWAIPIKEINQNHLILYGLARKKGFVKLHEIKEIKNKSKIFIPD